MLRKTCCFTLLIFQLCILSVAQASSFCNEYDNLVNVEHCEDYLITLSKESCLMLDKAEMKKDIRPSVKTFIKCSQKCLFDGIHDKFMNKTSCVEIEEHAVMGVVPCLESCGLCNLCETDYWFLEEGYVTVINSEQAFQLIATCPKCFQENRRKSRLSSTVTV